MHIHNESIAMHHARALVTSAERNGMDSSLMLAHVGLSHDMISSAQLRMTPQQYSDLLRYYWENADDEFVGMATSAARHGTFSLMAKQAVFKADLRGVYSHLCRFYDLVTQAIRIELIEENSEARLRLKFTDAECDPENMLCEFLLMLWHRFPSWLICQSIELKKVHFSHPRPIHHPEDKMVFGCTILYDQPHTELYFDTKWLDAPVVQTEPTLRAHLRRAPLDWVSRQQFSQQFTRKVLDHLQLNDDIGTVTMEQLADRMHLTSRTLRRKLTAENTAFQLLKDQIRRDRALHFLSQSSIPVSEISRKLGFSDPAAFSRAFKNWTGVAPSHYRKD